MLCLQQRGQGPEHAAAAVRNMGWGYVVGLDDCISDQLLSYSISSGALGSPDLLQSHFIITVALHIASY